MLKMAQCGIMVAPHGNNGTMINKRARVTLPGDLMGSSWGLGMVSGSAMRHREGNCQVELAAEAFAVQEDKKEK